MSDAPVPPPPPPPDPAAAPPPRAEEAVPEELASYPVQLNIERQEEYSRFMPLIKWLLAIPHYFCLLVLEIRAFFVAIAAAVAVLFTGRYPRGMFDYMVGVHRWGYRVAAY